MSLFKLLLPLALLLPFGATHSTELESEDGESMRFLVSYRGVFSAMAWIDIADAVLRGRTRGTGGQQVQELELLVSSEPHGFVESVFPFRYRARTLFQPEDRGSLAFERFKQTKKRKHDLFWVDRGQGRVVRFRPNGKNPQQATLPDELAVLMDPDRQMLCEDLGARLGASPLFDRLSLLHRLRRLDLNQREHVVPVTDGKRQLSYRITREKEDTVEAAGRSWPAWKLKVVQVDGSVDRDTNLIHDHPAEHAGDAGRRSHRPVYVWLSRDAHRLPLLFENRHAIGRFTVRLAEADYRLSDVSKFAQHPEIEADIQLVARARSR